MEQLTTEEYEQIKTFVCSVNTVSTAIIQYGLKWGYSKTVFALDELVKGGVVIPVKCNSEGVYWEVLQYSPVIKEAPPKVK